MGNWWKKSVAFNLDKPDERALADYANSLDNFSAAVRRWLHEMRKKDFEKNHPVNQ